MHYLTAPFWCRGNKMKVNQDSIAIQQVMTKRGRILLAVVCDGMGGMDYGQEASGYVARRIQEWFYESLMDLIGRKRPYWVIRRSFERMLYDIQDTLIEGGKKQKVRLGTTMTVLVLWEDKYILWHLGDSRVYKLHYYHNPKNAFGKGCLLLTRNHVMDGNKLTKCVGSFDFFDADYSLGRIKYGDCFLLCSDGFWHMLNQEEIYEALTSDQTSAVDGAQKVLRELGAACIKRGETDNLSAVFIRADR